MRGLWWAPAALVGTIVVLGSVGLPATPFIIAGAAIFGPVWGTFWNWVGIFLCSLTGFLLARLLGREFVERIGGAKIQRAEKLLHRRGFMPLIAIRFLPIPFTLVNAAAAVVGVKLPKFLAATAIGLLPPIAILTYFSSALLDAATGDRAEDRPPSARRLDHRRPARLPPHRHPPPPAEAPPPPPPHRPRRAARPQSRRPARSTDRPRDYSPSAAVDLGLVDQEDALAGVLLGVELEVADDSAEDLLERAGAEAGLSPRRLGDGAGGVGARWRA